MWRVAPSRIQGYGIIADRPIPRGSNLGLAHWWNGSTWATTSLGEYHNHAIPPTATNVRVGSNRYLVATRDIRPGEEITVDYRLQPDLEQPRPGWY